MSSQRFGLSRPARLAGPSSPSLQGGVVDWLSSPARWRPKYRAHNASLHSLHRLWPLRAGRPQSCRHNRSANSSLRRARRLRSFSLCRFMPASCRRTGSRCSGRSGSIRLRAWSLAVSAARGGGPCRWSATRCPGSLLLTDPGVPSSRLSSACGVPGPAGLPRTPARRCWGRLPSKLRLPGR